MTVILPCLSASRAHLLFCFDFDVLWTERPFFCAFKLLAYDIGIGVRMLESIISTWLFLLNLVLS